MCKDNSWEITEELQSRECSTIESSSISRVATIASIASIATIATVTNSSISRYMAMAIINSSDDSDIVRMASSVGIGLREAVGNLTKGVSLGICLGLTVCQGRGRQDNKDEGSHPAVWSGDLVTRTGPM